MTVSTKNISQTFQGNDVATEFGFQFPFFTKDEIDVYRIDKDSKETKLVFGTDYDIPGRRFPRGATVKLLKGPLASTDKLFVIRVIDYTQLTAFRNMGAYKAEAHENALDKLTMLVQQNLFNDGDNLKLNFAGDEWQTRGIPFDSIKSNSSVEGKSGSFDSLSVSDSASIKSLSVSDSASIKSLSSDLNASWNRITQLPPPSDDEEPMRKGDAIKAGAGPTFKYVDDKAAQLSNAGDSLSAGGKIWPVYNRSAAEGDTGLVDIQILKSSNNAYRIDRTVNGDITALDFDAKTATIGGVSVKLAPLPTITLQLATDIQYLTYGIAGQKVRWLGYYDVSDGGSNWGVIKQGSHTHDGGSIITITPNLYVEVNLKGGAVNAAKFGLQEGASNASTNHTQITRLFAYAKASNTSEVKFSAFYFISGQVPITQQGLRLTFSSKWNESGLQMTSTAGEFAAMLIFDAQNIVLKGGFFATENNQTSIFIRDGGKSHLEDFTVKFSEYGVLWEKGNAIVVKGMYAEVCVNGFVAQPRGEGDCNGGIIQGRAYGCAGVGFDLRPNIAPIGAGAPPLHNSIDFSCEAGGVGFKSYEARNNVGIIYCEGNTTNYDVDGASNLWTLKNADNQPGIIKDFASGFDFRGGTSYFNPCYIERRVQKRDFTTSGSLIGNGIDVFRITNKSGATRSLTLGFLSYVPIGHIAEIYMNESTHGFTLQSVAGITLIGDKSDLYGGPGVDNVAYMKVTKISNTEAILWRT